MKQFPFRIVHARSVLATIVLVALGAASSSAQSSASPPVAADAIRRPDSRRCPSTDAAAVRLPQGIQVADDLRPRLHAMLEKSATFRSQCRRIGEMRQLYVRVRLDARITGRTYRAVSDGVDLLDLEGRGVGAWKSGHEMFETERAVSVGRRVWREMREPASAPRLAGPAEAETAAVGPALR
jgi:hypothetical protein